MNYWFAETTGLDVATPLFDYIEVRSTRYYLRLTIATTDVDALRKHGPRVERKLPNTYTTSTKVGSLTTRYVALSFLDTRSKPDVLTCMI